MIDLMPMLRPQVRYAVVIADIKSDVARQQQTSLHQLWVLLKVVRTVGVNWVLEASHASAPLVALQNSFTEQVCVPSEPAYAQVLHLFPVIKNFTKTERTAYFQNLLPEPQRSLYGVFRENEFLFCLQPRSSVLRQAPEGRPNELGLECLLYYFARTSEITPDMWLRVLNCLPVFNQLEKAKRELLREASIGRLRRLGEDLKSAMDELIAVRAPRLLMAAIFVDETSHSNNSPSAEPQQAAVRRKHFDAELPEQLVPALVELRKRSIKAARALLTDLTDPEKLSSTRVYDGLLVAATEAWPDLRLP